MPFGVRLNGCQKGGRKFGKHLPRNLDATAKSTPIPISRLDGPNTIKHARRSPWYALVLDCEANMKQIIFLICLLAPVTTGCHSVTIRKPLGEDDPTAHKSLIGTWTNDDGGVIEAHVSKRGQLFVGGLEWDDATDKFKAETLNVRATKAGKLRLVQANVDSKMADNRFAFGRYEIEDGKTIRIYWPNTSIFEEAVNAGKLKGTVVKKQFSTDVRLDEPSAAVLAFITQKGVDVCFEKEPFTLTLLHRSD
jgi:hypothetical protein